MSNSVRIRTGLVLLAIFGLLMIWTKASHNGKSHKSAPAVKLAPKRAQDDVLNNPQVPAAIRGPGVSAQLSSPCRDSDVPVEDRDAQARYFSLSPRVQPTHSDQRFGYSEIVSTDKSQQNWAAVAWNWRTCQFLVEVNTPRQPVAQAMYAEDVRPEQQFPAVGTNQPVPVTNLMLAHGQYPVVFVNDDGSPSSLCQNTLTPPVVDLSQNLLKVTCGG
jgi:hypothetical protein